MTSVNPPLSGDLILRQAADWGLKIISAPPLTRATLESLRTSHPGIVINGDHVIITDQVIYRIIGWDPAVAALIMELVEDRRPQAAEQDDH